MALIVWCVCVGDKYHSGYVYALKEMVEKNLTIEHEFKCITTRNLPGIDTVLPPVPYQGWWSKLGLFYPRVAREPSLYFDLDVVITGNIDYLAEYTKHQFSAPANWPQSGWGGLQSSVMAWSGNFTRPYDELKWPEDSNKFHGDQEYIYNLIGDKYEKIPGIGSYKYHVMKKGEIPLGMRVCVFHGKPDPHEVDDPCILPYTSTLRSLINENMDNGFMMGSSAGV